MQIGRPRTKNLLVAAPCRACGSTERYLNGKCPECSRRATAESYDVGSDFALSYYGPGCRCCGESDRRMLAIHHMNDDGQRESQLGRPFYAQLYRIYQRDGAAGMPTDLEVLCYNCHAAHHKNGGICPHRSRGSRVLAWMRRFSWFGARPHQAYYPFPVLATVANVVV
jgi:hypothetical protein